MYSIIPNPDSISPSDAFGGEAAGCCSSVCSGVSSLMQGSLVFAQACSSNPDTASLRSHVLCLSNTISLEPLSRTASLDLSEIVPPVPLRTLLRDFSLAMTSDAEESEPPDVPTQEPFESYNLPNQYFLGPKSERHEGRRRDKVQDAYASISILEPVVTVERHNDEYHIAARFNIETTILGYDYKSKRFGARGDPSNPRLSRDLYASADFFFPVAVTNDSSKISVSNIGPPQKSVSS